MATDAPADDRATEHAARGRRLRRLRIALWATVAVGALLAAGLSTLAPSAPPMPVAASSEADKPYGGPFRLVDGEGRDVTEAALEGHPSAVFFGFTHCPEVCPTTLAELATLVDELGPKGETLRVFFVTVDPERDTPEVMKGFVSAISPRFTGLTGPPEAVSAMLKDWGIFAKRVPLDRGDYTMDHTATVLLLDRERRLFGTLAWGEDRAAALAKLKRLVGA